MFESIIQYEAQNRNISLCWWTANCLEEVIGDRRINSHVTRITSGQCGTINELCGKPEVLSVTPRVMHTLTVSEQDKLNQLVISRRDELLRQFPELRRYA